MEEILGAAGPQLAWTLMSFGMMTLAHYIHVLAIGWQLSSDEDSDDEDSDDEGYPAASGLGRMMNANDCAYAVMDAGLYVASSFIIASSCAGERKAQTLPLSHRRESEPETMRAPLAAS